MQAESKRNQKVEEDTDQVEEVAWKGLLESQRDRERQRAAGLIARAERERARVEELKRQSDLNSTLMFQQVSFIFPFIY